MEFDQPDILDRVFGPDLESKSVDHKSLPRINDVVWRAIHNAENVNPNELTDPDTGLKVNKFNIRGFNVYSVLKSSITQFDISPPETEPMVGQIRGH